MGIRNVDSLTISLFVIYAFCRHLHVTREKSRASINKSHRILKCRTIKSLLKTNMYRFLFTWYSHGLLLEKWTVIVCFKLNLYGGRQPSSDATSNLGNLSKKFIHTKLLTYLWYNILTHMYTPLSNSQVTHNSHFRKT